MARRRDRLYYKVRKAPMVVIGMAVLLWIAGVATGEPERVWEQACQICLSCIGLG